jgi:hypothetical protein
MAHNGGMSSLRLPQTSLPNPENHGTKYPTPPPLSSHAHENNNDTPKKAKNTCQNKQLTGSQKPFHCADF